MNNDIKADLIRIEGDGKKIYRWKTVIRIISLILAIILLLALIIYFATDIAIGNRSFPVTLDSGVGKTISLCETEDFKNSTVNLKATIIENMSCMSEFMLPSDIDLKDGSHNGDNYIAYSFYLRNNSSEAINLEENMKILSSKKNADAAVRIKLYRNGEFETYAKEAEDGSPEYGTTPFTAADEVFNNKVSLEADQVNRYTIVIWLEGDDPECLDDIKGGSLRFYVGFNVVND